MIDILLPTYNGSKYIRQQIDSILSQTYKDWRLLIRDDGSKDDTLDIVKKYRNYYPEKFIIIEDNKGNQGTSGSNDLLLKRVTSEYFMYCDQDDLWEPNKIEESMQVMQRLEKEYCGKPILVCSDACCIDENNQFLYGSFFENQKFIDTTDNFYKMLALNIVQGSTALMNYKVKDTIKFIPKGLYHDWWSAVNVAYFGKVAYIHKPLLRYRQHSKNVVGALNVNFKYLIGKLCHVKQQMSIYLLMYRSLLFKPSIIKWAYYKLVISVKRI